MLLYAALFQFQCSCIPQPNKTIVIRVSWRDREANLLTLVFLGRRDCFGSMQRPYLDPLANEM